MEKWSAAWRAWRRAVGAVRGAVAYHGSVGMISRKALKVLQREGASGVAARARAFMRRVDLRRRMGPEGQPSDVYGQVPGGDSSFQPKVSVIVPNYNHAAFLERRLESIYAQSYQNFEVILLDDASSDGSAAILQGWCSRHADRTRCVVNDVNSGGVFHQWNKGLSLADGELVWIAESDDYCDTNFLEELVRFFQNPAVRLAFSRSDFVDAKAQTTVWSSEEYLADIDSTLWKAPFLHSAHALVNHGWGVKNFIANVSSTLMRHPRDLALLQDPSWASLRLCGDWVFYLHMARGGLVGYTPLTTNFYRQHVGGTSAQTQKTDTYYREFEHVLRELFGLYKLERDVASRQRESLLAHWRRERGEADDAGFDSLYRIERARSSAATRRPNVLMVGYALAAGGGETFPIYLANQLKAHGWPVAFFNCKEEPTVPGVRAMLDPSIPLLEIEGIHHIGRMCQDMGIEIIHSHHAWVDLTLAACLLDADRPRHVISMHGMYEMIEPERLASIVRLVDRHIDAIVYTADKNLRPFPPEFLARKTIRRVNNALPKCDIQPAERASLGIGVEDFVLCLVSRALPDKGWQAAIEAVLRARQLTSVPVQLLLIGTGPEYDRLRPLHGPDTGIHFLGFRSNIRDWFAMADAGLLPTRFAGESFPLVLIDCLLAGRPVFATDVGEISPMLAGEHGFAGWLFPLENGAVPVDRMARCIAEQADRGRSYAQVLANVPSVARKFDIVTMAGDYEKLYLSLAQSPAVPASA